jgi:hypothetical protein
MVRGLRTRLTYANVMATVAVFIALGGGAYAAVKLPANSVGAKQIKKSAVTSAKIGKSAVTIKKIGKNAVDSSKVKNGSLTAADINLATLPKSPSAANADNAGHATNADNATNATNATSAGHATTADTASGLTPHEAVHMVGASGEPGFASGASNFPDVAGPPTVKYHKAGFYKDKEGLVHLQGIVVTGATGIVFNLPAGYRPAQGTIAALTVFCNDCSRTVTGGGGGSYYDSAAPLLVAGPGIDPSVPDGALLVSAPGGTTVSLDGVSFEAEA